MSSWGNNDNAANAPYWAINSTLTSVDAQPVGTRPTSANVALLYGNTTANVYTTNETIGLFAIDAQEIQAQGHGFGAHAGWNIRKVGAGGRAGRIQTETLVTLANVISDGDNQIYANVAISLSGPSNFTVNSNTSFANTATFTVSPTLTGNTAATLTYQWQYNNGSTWVNIPANTTAIHWSGVTSATLLAQPATTANNGTILRVVVTAADEGVTATSANATLSVPA